MMVPNPNADKTDNSNDDNRPTPPEAKHDLSISCREASGNAEFNVTIAMSEFENSPEHQDDSQLVERLVTRHLERHVKEVYSLASVRVMVSEKNKFERRCDVDEREFEVWAKW